MEAVSPPKRWHLRGYQSTRLQDLTASISKVVLILDSFEIEETWFSQMLLMTCLSSWRHLWEDKNLHVVTCFHTSVCLSVCLSVYLSVFRPSVRPSFHLEQLQHRWTHCDEVGGWRIWKNYVDTCQFWLISVSSTNYVTERYYTSFCAFQERTHYIRVCRMEKYFENKLWEKSTHAFILHKLSESINVLRNRQMELDMLQMLDNVS
jgi:hypothetical protein